MIARSDKSATAEEIAAIEELVTDLEKRLRRLAQTTRGESASGSKAGGLGSDVLDRIGNLVRESVSSVAGTARNTASGVSQSLADEAARIGSDALKTLTDEVERRPLLMLGLAAGLGFVLGRRSQGEVTPRQ